MFMFLWKPFLRFKAKNVEFEDSGTDLSTTTIKSYDEIKGLYKSLIKDIIDVDSELAPEVARNFLSFYLQAETLLLNLINEMFKKSFNETIEKRKPIFNMLNKLFKIMMHVDSLRLRYPDVFCKYTEYKMNNSKFFSKKYSDLEDQKISILSLISLPMGRLILSLFTSDKFELFYPTLLSKRSRVFLDKDRKKVLYMYCRLSEKYNFKYILIYFAVIYKRFYGQYSFSFDNEINHAYKSYIDMLHSHE